MKKSDVIFSMAICAVFMVTLTIDAVISDASARDLVAAWGVIAALSVVVFFTVQCGAYAWNYVVGSDE